MYQSIFWDYQYKQCHLRDDTEGWITFPYKPTYFKIDPKGKFKTLDGKTVSQTERYDKEDPYLYEKDVDMPTRILIDVYRDIDDIPTFHNKVFIDIETEPMGAINLEYCKNAPGKVTAIALYDVNTKEYFVFILDENKALKESKKDNVIVIPCHNEHILFTKFIDKWQEIDPTIVSGWNIDGFDIPYLYNRMIRIVGQKNANKLSPLGIVQLDDFDLKQPYKIAGISSLDYLRLYKKFIPKQQRSYALDWIGKEEINQGKIKYTGSLNKLFKDDVDTFIKYNVNDVEIVVKIDEKRKFIDLAIMVCHMGHVPYHYVYQTSRVLEGAIMTYLKRNDIVSPNKPTTIYPELKAQFKDHAENKEKFPGAMVKEPIPGLYGWNIDCDLESLHPSIMRTLNIGTETYIGRIVVIDNTDISWSLKQMKEKDKHQKIQIESQFKKTKEITIGKLIETIEENKLLISPNGCMFSSDEMSTVNKIVTEWFFKRKEFKKMMIDAGKKEDHVLYEFYNDYQKVIKVFLNGIYGSLGLVSFRYTDASDILAMTVTLTCRHLNNICTFDEINKKINEELDTDNDYVLMGDTDSSYINVEPLLKKRHPGIDFSNDDDVISKIRPMTEEFPKYINEFYDRYAPEHLNQYDDHFFKTKSETIAKSLYISGKKQYAQYLVDKEGVKPKEKDQFDFKGLDFMKSSFPILFSEFAKDVIKGILIKDRKSDVDKKLLDFREKFLKMSLEEIAKPTGINELNKYIKFKPKNGKIFSEVESGTPAHVKCAIFYNDLLTHKGLNKKHPVIQVGEKIKWMYLKKNPYKLDALGFTDESPDELKNFVIEYADKGETFNAMLVKKLQKIYDNLDWGVINFNKNVNKFLSYK